MLIFEEQQADRFSGVHAPSRESLSYDATDILSDLPDALIRQTPLGLPAVSELQVVRHYTTLSRKNYSIDTHMYPLGSCTMKYNPRAVHRLASLAAFTRRHPLIPAKYDQAVLSCLFGLQEILKDVTGMKAVSLVPMAGAQGEFAGVKMIKAYHAARGDFERDEMIVPDAAHGTNPASAVQCGLKVKEIKTGADGDIDLDVLREALGPRTAGIMLTNPSTLGVFERNIVEISKMVHEAGGLLYYDGANLNAILGRVRPGDMGFDVMHMNLHKTFATPHGGGGPGAGPVAVSDRLVPFLPVPLIAEQDGEFVCKTEQDCPQTIGRFSTFFGNSGILLRAYFYARLLGRDGMRRVSDYSTLNANYMLKKLERAGFTIAFPKRFATHEFIVTMKPELQTYQVSAMDFAKRLLDYGFHAPTTYFPLLIPECLLIEPTETESRAEIDRCIDAMCMILKEIKEDRELVKGAPYSLPVKRLDDVKAARELDLIWSEG